MHKSVEKRYILSYNFRHKEADRGVKNGTENTTKYDMCFKRGTCKSIGTVSYTHLDVYKRQIKGRQQVLQKKVKTISFWVQQLTCGEYGSANYSFRIFNYIHNFDSRSICFCRKMEV